MKVSIIDNSFKPITITIETEDELIELLGRLNGIGDKAMFAEYKSTPNERIATELWELLDEIYNKL